MRCLVSYNTVCYRYAFSLFAVRCLVSYNTVCYRYAFSLFAVRCLVSFNTVCVTGTPSVYLPCGAWYPLILFVLQVRLQSICRAVPGTPSVGERPAPAGMCQVHAHTPIFEGSVLELAFESANYCSESADSNADATVSTEWSIIVACRYIMLGRLSVKYVFICRLMGMDRFPIGQVGMGLKTQS